MSNDYEHSRYRYRISWENRGAVLQQQERHHDAKWYTVRIATTDDRAAMVDGVIGYDPETKPSTLAFARYVANGGD